MEKLVDKIYYITERKEKLGFKTATISECVEYCKNLDSVGLDIEATGLDPYRAKLLLSSIGDYNKTFVIDHTTISPDFMKEFSHIPIVGQNLKYDTKVLLVHGIQFNKVFDTMIAEQVMRMGVKGGNGLDKILKRRLNIESQLPKETRLEFINAVGFVPERKHIVYSAEDTLYIKLLMEKQVTLLNNYNLLWVCENIEFPLLLHLAKSEVEGIRFNVPKHKINIQEMNKELLLLERKMDEEVKQLCIDNDIPLIGKWNRERNTSEIVQTSLFDNVKEKVIKTKNKGNINYGSSAQIQDLFISFNQPLPLIKDGFSYKESTGVEALNAYLAEGKAGPLEEFIKMLLVHRGLSKQISSFGQNLIDIINEYSGNIHTIYRQAGADTGRFQSGDTKNGYINSQQIPALEKFRTCFGQYDNDEDSHDYAYMTMDLSGAELVILASNANDEVLMELLDDPHSAIATASTQALINYIFNVFSKNGLKGGDYKTYSEIPQHLIHTNVRLIEELTDILKTEERVKEVLCTGTFVVSKKTSKDIRNSYKAVAYGLAYGASASRISEVMNVPMAYAEIIEKAVRNLIPKTFTYLDGSSAFGLRNGYVITCERTKSRRWFKEITDANKFGYTPEKKTIGNVERACKNSPIQGTQAYMVKEATNDMLDYINKNNIDANIVMWVHDEWVIRLPKRVKSNKEYDINKLAEQLKSIALNACNKYLKNGLKMDADYSINDTWVK